MSEAKWEKPGTGLLYCEELRTLHACGYTIHRIAQELHGDLDHGEPDEGAMVGAIVRAWVRTHNRPVIRLNVCLDPECARSQECIHQ